MRLRSRPHCSGSCLRHECRTNHAGPVGGDNVYINNILSRVSFGKNFITRTAVCVTAKLKKRQMQFAFTGRRWNICHNMWHHSTRWWKPRKKTRWEVRRVEVNIRVGVNTRCHRIKAHSVEPKMIFNMLNEVTRKAKLSYDVFCGSFSDYLCCLSLKVNRPFN